MGDACLAAFWNLSMRLLIVLFASVLVCSQGWAQKQPKPKQNLTTAKPPSDPIAHAAGAPAIDVKTYIIGAEDLLFIQVWNEPQLTKQYNVRPDGKISLPLVGETQAATLTPEKLAANITETLAKFINHPDVSVSVQQVNSKKFFIMGEVQKTGSFPLLIP